MPQGEGFDKGAINPFIIDNDLLMDDSILSKQKEEQKEKDKVMKEEDKFETLILSKPFTPNFLRPIP